MRRRGVEAEIRSLLYVSVNAFADAEGLPVVWPNTRFDAQAHTNYLRAAVLPVTPRLLTVCDGGSVYDWILQINIYVPDGVGELVAQRYADKLRDTYPVGFELVGNHRYRVIEPAHVAPPVPVEGWYFTPVQHRFQTIQ